MNKSEIISCKHSKKCGGCDYIGYTYEQTLSIKQDRIKNLLSHSSVKPENFNKIKIIPSPKITAYRNRCQLQIKNGKPGFFERKSHNLINIDSCIMLEDALNNRILTLNFPSTYNGKIELFIINNKLHEKIIEEKFMNTFTQINTGVNKLIKNKVTEELNLSKNDNVLELYCGHGNFTFEIAKFCKVTGIDTNIKPNNNPNIEFIENYTHTGLQKLEKLNRLSSFSKLLLDPPRNGVDKKTINILSKYKFSKIVYISCKYESLLRDAEILTNKGYKWESSTLYDMFPFTKYLESVNIFTLSGTNPIY